MIEKTIDFNELKNFMGDIFQLLETDITTLSCDLDKVDLSSTVGTFKKEDNILFFTIGNRQYTITGESLIFNNSIYFVLSENENLKSSFLVSRSTESQNSHIFTNDNYPNGVDLGLGLSWVSHQIFSKIKKNENDLMKKYKRIPLSIIR